MIWKQQQTERKLPSPRVCERKQLPLQDKDSQRRGWRYRKFCRYFSRPKAGTVEIQSIKRHMSLACEELQVGIELPPSTKYVSLDKLFIFFLSGLLVRKHLLKINLAHQKWMHPPWTDEKNEAWKAKWFIADLALVSGRFGSGTQDFMQSTRLFAESWNGCYKGMGRNITYVPPHPLCS